MKKMRLSVLLVLIAFGLTVFASGEKSIIYKAYLESDMKTWRNVIDKMNKEQGKSNERNMELLNYEYGYIGWCLGMNNDAEAEEIIERSEKRMDSMESIHYKPSIISAYKSAFYGFKIALNKSKAPFLGGKSIDEAKKSTQLDPENYFGYIQLGNIDYFRPSIFGGSKKRAMENYLKAEKQMILTANYQNDWNYLSLLTQIAQGFEATKDFKNAENYYKKILSIAPNFGWVKNELYPKFIKKTK